MKAIPDNTSNSAVADAGLERKRVYLDTSYEQKRRGRIPLRKDQYLNGLARDRMNHSHSCCYHLGLSDGIHKTQPAVWDLSSKLRMLSKQYSDK